jgi:hypothetical protein
MQRTIAIAHLQPHPTPGAGQCNSGHGKATFVADWTALKRGDRIWIRRKGQTTVAGSVDDRTFDGNILWILPHGTSERKMYHRSDGDEVWSPQEPAQAATRLQLSARRHPDLTEPDAMPPATRK